MEETTAEIVASISVVLGLGLLRWLVLRYVHRTVDDPDVWFRAKRITTYTTTFIAAITLAWIWIDAFDSLPTYLGLVSAGVAIALADLLKNMAGWLYILIRRPLRLGDRIEVAGTAGDVVDIRLFRFSLMEIGNWVHADQSTGRLMHVPNGIVFTNPVANYTEGFEHIWHEIPVLVTFESNWEKARSIIREEIDKVSISDGHVLRRLRKAAREYQIKIGTLTPIVYLKVEDSGVLLTGRLLIPARERRLVDDRVWSAVLARFAEEDDIDLAYNTVRTFFAGPVSINHSDHEPDEAADSESGG
ncbi:MAG: mechanosensitive ion channel [Acidimicrobiia bacterium]|nr:mechanosensitive ion channel [Acidimicrobiia bacterium]